MLVTLGKLKKIILLSRLYEARPLNKIVAIVLLKSLPNGKVKVIKKTSLNIYSYNKNLNNIYIYIIFLFYNIKILLVI